MFRLLRENLLRVRINGGSSSPASKTSLLCFFHGNPSLKSITHSSESTPTAPTSSSLTISYLTTSCGLSSELALRASKWFTLKTTKNADLVLDCLRNHGFELTHIAKVIGQRPDLLKLHPERILNSKMDFLMRYGFSSSQLINLLSKDPSILTRSLENQIIPSLEFLKGLVGTQENVIAAINRSAYTVRPSRLKRLVPNISSLRDHGVPNSYVSKFIIKQPDMFTMVDPDRFRTSVVAVHGMGFNPLSTRFVEAVRAMLMSKSGWDEKYELYRSLGWSDGDFMSAFRMFPQWMFSSEKKVNRVFEFFVGELGWEPPSLSRCPVLITLSLEKRVIPRCSVLEVLLSKGLIEKDMKWSTALKLTEKQFLERFVTKYEEEAAELMRAYHGMTESKGNPVHA
ncbi:hypothetical protein QJS04_geneDACA003678 [Acorus gramineus]|uniref:Uncharacterized protein n=1 Tax=Acorus gramineus TaxID=55184 RepID=A0AAV9BN77_ACOGR|nr:hypothetical protein QJS04_geneDACA003678 [Acorus gramineus]